VDGGINDVRGQCLSAAATASGRLPDLQSERSADQFRKCAESCVTSQEAGWRNAKHVAQWRSTLATYAYPVLGGLPVGSVDTGLVLKVLEPLWATKPETAGRLRGTVLTAARTGEAIGAQWSEIDFAAKTWTVPVERMKAGKEHRIPLYSGTASTAGHARSWGLAIDLILLDRDEPIPRSDPVVDMRMLLKTNCRRVHQGQYSRAPNTAHKLREPVPDAILIYLDDLA
jgi:Phage integrase family